MMARSSANLAIAAAACDDPRGALREAIAKREAAKRRAAAAREEHDGWWQRRAETRTAVESAEQALTLAQDLLANPQAEGSGDLLTVRKAREALQDTRDALAAVERSKPRIEAEAKAAESALDFAEQALKRAIADVVRPAVLKLLANCETAARTHAELVAIIGLLCESGCLPPDVVSWGVPPAGGPEVLAPWRSALMSLRTDTDAALPQ